jgi:1-deoxy-D-xylulose-5-phosphate synthase
MAQMALDVAQRVDAQGIAAAVVDPRWVRPVAPELIEMAARHRLVVTMEDGGRAGGIGSQLSQALRDCDIDVPTRDVGIPQQFLEHGNPLQVRNDIGLTAQNIARRVVGWVSRMDTSDRAESTEEPSSQQR